MKNSFILYAEYWEDIKEFSMEEKALLLDLIFSYANGEDVECNDRMIKFYFNQIKRQMNRDEEKWEEIKEKRSEAGKKHSGNQYTRKKTDQAEHCSKNGTNGTSVPTLEQNGTNGTNGTVTVTADVDVDVTATVTADVGATSDAKPLENSENVDNSQTGSQTVIKTKINQLFGDNFSQDLYERIGHITQGFSPHKTNGYIEWLYEKSRQKNNPRSWLYKCAGEKYLLDAFSAEYQEPVQMMRCPVCNALHGVKAPCGYCGLTLEERANKTLVADLRRKWGFESSA